MEGCSASVGAMASLPDDPLVDILSRVPAKSICRFKCVSKAWRDLIAHPDHRKKLRQAMQGLFYAKISEADDSPTMMRFGFIDLLTARSVPLDIDPCFSFLREVPGMEILLFLDSCNGLILFGHFLDDSCDTWGYVVCNPTTKQWGAVSFGGSPAQPDLTTTKLAFDPAVSSHFYLVQLVMDKDINLVSLQVFSSETGVWSHSQTDEQEEQGELEGWPHQFELKFLSGPSKLDSAFLNGFLHFMVSGPYLDHIVALDVQGKARRMIEAPALRHRRGLCYLGQSQGQLHYMIEKLHLGRGEENRVDIWVLQDYGKEKWESKGTVSFKVLVEGFDDRIDPKSDIEVICIHPDCNVVFFNYALRLIAYDMDSKKASVVTTLGDENQFWNFAPYVPCFSKPPSLLTNEH